MPIGTLFDSGLDTFAGQEADGPATLWFFVHIPKTAGSSFRTELTGILQPQFNLRIDARDPSLSRARRRDQAIGELIGTYAERRYRFASGHVTFAEAQRIRDALPQTKFITMLRDPVARVVSQYRYFRSPENPEHRSVLTRYPDFAAFLDDGENSDVMFKWLAPDPALAVDAVTAVLEREFAFVGLLERYPLSFRLLTTLLGQPSRPELYIRRTAATDDNTVELTDEIVRQIRRRNQKDMALYRHFRTRFASYIARSQKPQA